MNKPTWTNEEWEQTVSPDKSAKVFKDLITDKSHIESASDKFDYARLRWLALTHTNVAALNENGISFDDKGYTKLRREATFNWLKICVNTRSDSAEARESDFFFTLKGVDREEDIRRIIKSRCIFGDEDCKDDEDKKQRFIYLHYLVLWFLKRYDQITSLQIAWGIRSFRYKYDYKKRFPKVAFPILLILIAIFVVRLFYNVDMILFNFDWKAFSQMDHSSIFENTDFFAGGINLPRILEFAVLVIAFAIFVFWVLDIFRSINLSLWSNFFHLRLVSGIAIGYIALLFQANIWEVALEIDRIKGAVIVFSASLFSLYYLFKEIRNVVKNTRIAIYRCLSIWLIGLFESLALGIIAQDLLSWYYYKDYSVEILEKMRVMGLFSGWVYPKVLILFTPLALVIGIFVQIIWEDKPITHPF